MEITTIGGAIVLVLLSIAIFCYYKFCVPKTADKEMAENFINGYKSVFEKTIGKIIDELDITKYHTIEEFESDIFGIAYDECWDYIEKALQQALSNSSIGKLIAKCITREAVEEVVEKLIKISFLQKAEAKYVARISVTSEEMIAADEAAQIEADLYETGQKEVEPYIEPEPQEPDVELNPQTDEEGAYSEDDISQEIVGETSITEEVPTHDIVGGDDGEPLEDEEY